MRDNPELRRDRVTNAAVATCTIVALGFMAANAFAQDAMVESVPLAEDPHRLALVLLDGINGSNWGIVVSAVLVGLVWALRRFGKQLVPALAPFLDHPVVAWTLPSLAAILGAILTSLVAGTPISVGLVVTAIITGLTANGMFNGMRQVAQAKGAKAAGEVDTKAEAVNVLKGPKP